MAVWQFKFSLVPIDGIRRVHGNEIANLEIFRTSPDGPNVIDDAKVPNYWDHPATLRQIALAVSGFLPEMASWSEDARMFGQADSDKIEVWDDDVSCFIDMRYFSEDLLRKILVLAHKFQCDIAIVGSGVVVKSTMTEVVDQILISNAYKFCANPAEYLQSLKNES